MRRTDCKICNGRGCHHNPNEGPALVACSTCNGRGYHDFDVMGAVLLTLAALVALYFAWQFTR